MSPIAVCKFLGARDLWILSLLTIEPFPSAFFMMPLKKEPSLSLNEKTTPVQKLLKVFALLAHSISIIRGAEIGLAF